jgi:hypothetical protein
MHNHYQIYREKLLKFNKWEKEHLINTTEKDRLRQFQSLFELNYLLPLDVQKRAHKEHLEALIAIQKRIKYKKQIARG